MADGPFVVAWPLGRVGAILDVTLDRHCKAWHEMIDALYAFTCFH